MIDWILYLKQSSDGGGNLLATADQGFAALDMPASGAVTRERLGWMLAGPTLLENFARMDCSIGTG